MIQSMGHHVSMMSPHGGGRLLKRSLYYLQPTQHDWLREEAHLQRTTASSLVRLAVDLLQEQAFSGAIDITRELKQRQEGGSGLAHMLGTDASKVEER